MSRSIPPNFLSRTYSPPGMPGVQQKFNSGRPRVYPWMLEEVELKPIKIPPHLANDKLVDDLEQIVPKLADKDYLIVGSCAALLSGAVVAPEDIDITIRQKNLRAVANEIGLTIDEDISSAESVQGTLPSGTVVQLLSSDAYNKCFNQVQLLKGKKVLCIEDIFRKMTVDARRPLRNKDIRIMIDLLNSENVRNNSAIIQMLREFSEKSCGQGLFETDVPRSVQEIFSSICKLRIIDLKKDFLEKIVPSELTDLEIPADLKQILKSLEEQYIDAIGTPEEIGVKQSLKEQYLQIEKAFPNFAKRIRAHRRHTLSGQSSQTHSQASEPKA